MVFAQEHKPLRKDHSFFLRPLKEAVSKGGFFMMAETVMIIDQDGVPQEQCPELVDRMQELLNPGPEEGGVSSDDVDELRHLAQALPVAIRHDRLITEMTTIVQDRWIESGEALSPRDLAERLGYSVAFCRQVLWEFSGSDLARRKRLMKEEE